MNREYTASCAVCGGPGEPECPCEGEKLQQCINQAEKAWIESWVTKTREWVTNNAINAVTTVFNKKKEARKQMYRDQVTSIPYWPQFQEYRGQPPLPPHIVAEIRRRLNEAEVHLKRGIDHDWKQCVLRYPDVLAHFYNQIKVNSPREPEQPFPHALAGGGAPRPPSVINLPPPPPAPPSILRSATAPPKKQRRASKVNMERGDMDTDFMAMLSSQLEGLNKNTGFGGRTKAATPAPQSSTPAPRPQRPGGKRRESKEYGQARQAMPPHVPYPPMGAMGNMAGFSRPTSIYDSFH